LPDFVHCRSYMSSQASRDETCCDQKADTLVTWHRAAHLQITRLDKWQS
jgi:hypothetical protein